MRRSIKNNHGFSLIELLTVVAIIGILSMIGIPRYQSFRVKAYQAEVTTADSFDMLHSSQLCGIRNALGNPAGTTDAQMGVLCEGIPPAVVAKIGALTTDQYIKLLYKLKNSEVPENIEEQKRSGILTAAEMKIADKDIERFGQSGQIQQSSQRAW